MKAELITIGDEILIGQIVDTNSAWMAQELNAIGVTIAQITSISDNAEHLVEALDEATKRADVIIMTGGLGPTKDDRTKNVLCNYFNSKLVRHQPTYEHVMRFFESRGYATSDINKDQALVPECCQVLFNPVGTAPGMWFEHKGKIYVSMPGVPFEMKQIMTDEVLPRLAQGAGIEAIVHKTVQTFGVGESMLAERIEAWEDALPSYIHLAYLPSPGQVRLRLSAFGDSKESLETEVNQQVDELLKLISEAVYGYGDQTLAGAVGELLLQRGQTLTVAESCTGGLIQHSITSVPGSSQWFRGGFVAYSNELKMKVLGVESVALEQHGAVSAEVVKQMAEGARKVTGADFAVATSGIAGPDGGTDEKPVGTVWIAVATPSGVEAQLFKFVNNRERNIIRSSQTALNLLRILLLK